MKPATILKTIIPVFALVSGIWILLFSSNVKASGYSGISEGSSVHMYTGTYEVSRNDEGEYKKVVYADTGGSKVVKSNDGVELSNWDKEFVYTDQVGSTSFNLDTNGDVTPEFKNGNDINKLRYFVYGSTISTVDKSNLPTEDTYTGQKQDSELDLMYYNARYYDPARGRFIQADSVNDGLNRYMYVAGNPVNANDPSGNRNDPGAGGGGWGGMYGNLGPSDCHTVAECQAVSTGVAVGVAAPAVMAGTMVGGTVAVSGINSAVAAATPTGVLLFTQLQRALGSAKMQSVNLWTQFVDAASGLACSLNNQLGCLINNVAGPLATTTEVGENVGLKGAFGDVYIVEDGAIKVYRHHFAEARWQYEYLNEYAPESEGLLPTPIGALIDSDTGVTVGYKMTTAPGSQLKGTKNIVPETAARNAVAKLSQLHSLGFRHGDVYNNHGNIIYDPKTNNVTLVDPYSGVPSYYTSQMELDDFYYTMTHRSPNGKTPRKTFTTPIFADE